MVNIKEKKTFFDRYGNENVVKVAHGWVSKTPSCVENEERGELSWVGGMEEEEGLAMLITHLHHFSHSLSPLFFTLHPPLLSHQLPRSPPFSLLDLLSMHSFFN